MLSCGIAALYPLAKGRSTLSFLAAPKTVRRFPKGSARARNRPPRTPRGTGTKRLVW